MSSIDETLVREYFEGHGFMVCQRRKYGVFGREKTVNEEVDLVVLNPQATGDAALGGFEMTTESMSRVRAAMVSIKGWHTETISPGVLAHHARSFRVPGKEAIAEAQRLIGDGVLMKIFVLPGLPRGAKQRQEAIDALKAVGVEAVVCFPTILRDLIDRVQVNRNYQKSDLLEILRLLKNYDLLKDPQLELKFARKAAKPPRNKG